jgi:hypothetical protein
MNAPYGEEYKHIYDFWTELWNNLHIENINIYGDERIVFHKDNEVFMQFIIGSEIYWISNELIYIFFRKYGNFDTKRSFLKRMTENYLSAKLSEPSPRIQSDAERIEQYLSSRNNKEQQYIVPLWNSTRSL